MSEPARKPPVNIEFSAMWFHNRYGLDFGERTWRDPILRTEQDRQMRRLLHEAYGGLGIGEADPAPRPNVEAYGHRFMSKVWGCEILYQADQAPAALVLDNPDERIDRLECPTVSALEVTQRAMDEARLLESRYGQCDGMINWGGPLNNAVSVLGEDILAAIMLRPEAARRVLMQMTQTIFDVYDTVTARVNRTPAGGKRPIGGIGNCPVCMVSPESYREVVLPADLFYFSGIQGRGLHHCGAFHPYAQVYKALGSECLQIGYTSDRRASRAAWPDTPISLMLEASAVIGKTPQQVRQLVRNIVEEGGPARNVTDIAVADAGPEVSDSIVEALRTAL